VALAADLPAGQPANPSIDQAPPVATPSTESFLASVAAGNRFEIDSSKLALERAKSAAVNIFAHRLVDEHTSAGARFKQAVSQTKLPPPPEELDARHQAILDDLKARGACGPISTTRASCAERAHGQDKARDKSNLRERPSFSLEVPSSVVTRRTVPPGRLPGPPAPTGGPFHT